MSLLKALAVPWLFRDMASSGPEGEANASRSTAGHQGKAAAGLWLRCVTLGCTALRALKGGKCLTCRCLAKNAGEKRLQAEAKEAPTKIHKAKKDA